MYISTLQVPMMMMMMMTHYVAPAQRCAPLRVFYGPSKTVSQSGTIQAFAKDLPVQCVRPRRLVTFA